MKINLVLLKTIKNNEKYKYIFPKINTLAAPNRI